MKKRFGFIPMTLLVAGLIALSGCDQVFGSTIELDDAPLAGEKLIDFKDGRQQDIAFESDGWSNGSVFNVVWKQHNVHYENGVARLGITEEKATAWINDEEVEFNYTAGELRTQNYYGYGDYEVSMKPSKNSGTASTFFTCTGPYDSKNVLDENGDPITVNNPHDEIDIEFLGKDTTKVQFNFFVNGTGGNEYMYDLGFDASEEFHEYGFRWAEDSITWFVDDEPVYKVTTDASVPTGSNVRKVSALPQTAGRILANYWCGTSEAFGWMGRFNGETEDNGTQYKWFATTAIGAPLNPTEEPPVSEGDIDWANVNEITQTFASTELYTVESDGTYSRITYTAVPGQSYKNVNMNVADIAASNNHVYLKVKNDGTEEMRLRVNMYDAQKSGNNTSTNQSATMDGESVLTDMDWGGSFFDLAAGQEAELVIVYGAGVDSLELMPDSSRTDNNERAGNLYVDAIKFAASGDVEGGDEGGDDPIVPPSVDPFEGINTTDGEELTFNSESGSGYTITKNGKATNIVYEGAGNTYKPVTANGVGELANTHDTFTVKVTNFGINTSVVRFDVQGTTWVSTGGDSGTDATNLSATAEGGSELYTDLTWGGTKIAVAPAETVTLTIKYDAYGEQGLVKNLLVYVDSSTGSSEVTYGNLTISELTFSGEADIPSGGEDEPLPKEFDTITGWWTSNSSLYQTTSQNEGEEVVIVYNGTGNSYACVGADVAALANANNTFALSITNNVTTTSRVRIDIQGTTQVGNHTVINTSATGGDVWTDSEWGGSTLTVEGNTTVDVVITYDTTTERGLATNLVVMVDSGRGDSETYASNVTLSNFKFSTVGGEEEIEYNSISGWWSSNPSMNVTTADSNKEVTVNYEGAGNTYACVGADVASIANEHNTVSMKLTNNGSADIRVKLEIQGTTQVGNHKALNTTATGGDMWTDVDWGGSIVTIPAGESLDVVISYDTTTERGLATNFVVMVDSCRGDANTYTSSLTLSNIYFHTI